MNSHNGAIVLIALLPILPLVLYLRRSGKLSPRGARFAVAVSLVLLICGIVVAATIG